jgi:hypothetical protein
MARRRERASLITFGSSGGFTATLGPAGACPFGGNTSAAIAEIGAREITRINARIDLNFMGKPFFMVDIL